MVEDVKELVEETPPELLADIMDRGIFLAGAGSLLVGIDKIIAERVRIPVISTKDPQTAVVRGAAKILKNPQLLQKVRITGGLS